jgi:glycine/D-amino acid oxidase-like deaminating enzyme
MVGRDHMGWLISAKHPSSPNGYFALGYGGNGMTYSLIAAEIIRDIYTGRPNRDVDIFRFDR